MTLLTRIFSLLFSILSIIPASAEVNEREIPGLYDILKPEYGYLSVLNGLAILRSRVDHNIRFNGYFGPEREGYRCYAKLTDEQKTVDCPQDHRTALLQYVFPSPGGGQLVPNNNIHDLASSLTQKTIGTILRLLTVDQSHHESSQNTPEGIKKRINDFALGIFQSQFPELYAEIVAATPAIESTHAKKERQEKAKTEGIRLGKMKKNLQLLQAMGSPTPDQSQKIILLEGEIATLMRQLEELKQQSKSQEHIISQEAILHTLESHPNFKKALVLARLIVAALDEAQVAPSSYPPRFIENIFLCLAWRLAEKKDDFVEFYAGLGPQFLKPDYIDTTDGHVILPEKWSQHYDKKFYKSYKKQGFEAGKPILAVFDKMMTIPENVFYLTLAYDSYDNPFPRILDFSKSLFPYPNPGESLASEERAKREFPNCGEIALFNLFNVLLFNPKTKLFDGELLKILAPNARENFVEFYNNLSLESLETMSGKWSNIVSNIQRPEGMPEIRYLSKNDYGRLDLSAGVDNFLNVVIYLLNDPVLNEIDMSKQSREAAYEKVLDRLCEMVNEAKKAVGETYVLSWKESNGNKKISNLMNQRIELFVNDKPQFVITFTSLHFDFRPHASTGVNDWRKSLAPYLFKVVEEGIKVNGMHPLEMLLPFYANTQNSEGLLHQVEKPFQDRWYSFLTYSYPIDVNGILGAIKMAVMFGAKTSDPAGENIPIILADTRWFKNIPEDMTALARLSDLIIPLADSLPPHLREWYDEIPTSKKLISWYGVFKVYNCCIDNNLLNLMDLYGRYKPSSIEKKIVFQAISSNTLDMVKLFFKLNPNLMRPVIGEEGTPYEGETYLATAAKKGYLEIFKYLLSVIPDFKNQLHSAFLIALETHRLQILEYLFNELNYQPSPDTLLALKDTLFNSHYKNDRLKIMKLLIHNIPQLTRKEFFKNERGQTPVYYLCQSENEDFENIIKYIAENIPALADKDMLRDTDMKTPLFYSYINGNLSRMESLVKLYPQLLDADMLKDKYGNTPLNEMIKYSYAYSTPQFKEKTLDGIKYLVEKAPILKSSHFLLNIRGKAPYDNIDLSEEDRQNIRQAIGLEN